ncbi:aminotransferase class V-fold PLP-dependent enzyme [Catellatospora citrea]|uniref:Aminotransferase class V n=1 Tax=Catellatospora citrea TaxID=53366 RepID=A0A8J3KLI3_9ACTN|nr:aminotransferase class V-fold PLP-dependent enzyme [Catellatospora citrea]RKE09938.1 isopenicillin-N epimerase [Catellatospora citrea]GIG02017.1 aminotransferase class V [Catellatospora citrea]
MTGVPPAPLDGARELFALDPAVAHLNHGSFGAVPVPVREARQRLIDEHDANPTRFVTAGLWERVARARAAAAAFCGADPAGSAFVANATTGTSLVLAAVAAGEGDEIVVTDHGYHAVELAVEDQHRRRGVRVVTAPVELGASEADTVAAVLDRVGPRTRLVIVDQVSSATAQRHPVHAIAAALRERGVPLLVDGAHAPGMLDRPVAGLVADFWVGNLHKWAFAPPGAALLHVAPDWRDRMVPLVVSHSQPDGFPLFLEQQGTLDHSPWLAVPAGLDVFDRFGFDTIQRHNVALAAYGQRVLGQALGLDPDTLPDPGPEVPMRLLPLPAGAARDVTDTAALRTRISVELGVEPNVMWWRDRAFIRVSAQIYNSAADYDRFAAGLPGLLRG